MDIGGLVTSLLSGSAITYALGWIAGKKRNRADLEGVRLKNLESVIQIYEKVHTDLKEQLDTLSIRCKELSEEIEALRGENVSLKNEIKLLNNRLKNN